MDFWKLDRFYSMQYPANIQISLIYTPDKQNGQVTLQLVSEVEIP